MESKISIASESLANYVMFKLDKIENEFTLKELDQINEVVIDYVNDEGIINLNELNKFQNLKSITIRNGFIENDDYKIFLSMKKLFKLTFDKCEFENADLIGSINLKVLELIACKINDYSFIRLLNNLEELTILNGNVEMNSINRLKKLKFLRLSYSYIIENAELDIPDIKILYIDNTNIKKLEFIKKLSNLEKIIIDNNQYDNNKQIISYLNNENILVLDENMVDFGVENE